MKLARRGRAEIARFDPKLAAKRDAQADAVIQYAQRVKDWPMLSAAIQLKLEDQQAFVDWWEKALPHGPGPGRGKEIADRLSLSVPDVEKRTGIKAYQVSRWRRRLADAEGYAAMLFGVEYHKAMGVSDATAKKWTREPESYTPGEYIEAAREVMGGIDLDPASNAHAQETVSAGEYYDEAKNGLIQKWSGRVFLNPPYSFPKVGEFIEKLCVEYGAGNVTAAILLTNNNTDTKWWHMAALCSAAVCFTAGRINFYKADGSRTQPTNGQTFFYFGADLPSFVRVFTAHGFVMCGIPSS